MKLLKCLPSVGFSVSQSIPRKSECLSAFTIHSGEFELAIKQAGEFEQSQAIIPLEFCPKVLPEAPKAPPVFHSHLW